LGRYDEALEYLDRAIEIEPNYDDTWYWLGLILFEMRMLLVFDRKDEALESFEKAISINPNEAEYWYWKSRCLKDLFKKKEALKAIEKAISIERNEEYLQLRDSLHR
jgi:tetratricopeptide (TPR) repeat protein